MGRSIAILISAFLGVFATLLLSCVVSAQPVGDTAIVDVGPATAAVIAWLAPILLVLLVGGGGWIAARLAGLLGLKINALQRAVIDHGLDRAIGYAIAKLGDRAQGGIPVKVKSEAIAVAAEYAVNAIPGALKHFGKSRDDLAQMLESRLEGLLVDPDTVVSPPVRASAGPLGP